MASRFGAAEALLGGSSPSRRVCAARMVLATKGGISMGVPYDSSAAYLALAIDASLTPHGRRAVEL